MKGNLCRPLILTCVPLTMLAYVIIGIGYLILTTTCLWVIWYDLRILYVVAGFWGVFFGILFLPCTVLIVPFYALLAWGNYGIYLIVLIGGSVGLVISGIGYGLRDIISNKLDADENDMKKIILTLICLVVGGGCANETKQPILSTLTNGAWWVIKTTAKGGVINRNNPYVHGNTITHFNNQGGGLQVDAYGPGIHMNQYGQPVKLWPDFGGIPGESLQIKPNAYGHGVHMDQYGRPVREYPWP